MCYLFLLFALLIVVKLLLKHYNDSEDLETIELKSNKVYKTKTKHESCSHRKSHESNPYGHYSDKSFRLVYAFSALLWMVIKLPHL